jgi:AraC-like DNA-binding protein
MHESPVRLRYASTYQAPQGRDYPAHAHPAWEVIYYRTGNIRCRVEDAVFETQPGMLLLIPPGTLHADEAVTAYSQIFLRVTAPADRGWPRTCFDDSERVWGTLCGGIEQEWRRRERPLRDEMLHLLASELDLRLRRASGSASPLLRDPFEPLVRSAEEILETRYALPITLAEVAREVGASPGRLRLHFLRLRGRTPQTALQDVRLRHALDLIRGSSLTLEAIAGLCGYYSASHLSRYVRRETGRSPGALRQPDAAPDD